MPLGTYLTGKERTSGAHARYARPGDYSFYDAYNHIFKCKPQNLRRAFNDVRLTLLVPCRSSCLSYCLPFVVSWLSLHHFMVNAVVKLCTSSCRLWCWTQSPTMLYRQQ